MTEFETTQRLAPKHFIIVSLIITMLLDFIPLSPTWFFWLPDFSLLLLIYWTLNRPQLIGLTWAFIIGLLKDIALFTLLGQHALAYTITIFIIRHYQPLITLHGYGVQSLIVLFALLSNIGILFFTQLIHNQSADGIWYFLSAITGAFLWPLLNKIMLSRAHYHSS